MTFDKFNYLVMLCEEQNVTRAAQRLFITQPTLTAFVNTLERSLGFKLFDRSHNPVTLTRGGRLYMERMRRLLLEETQLIEDIRSMNRARDTIRIGVGQIHSEMWGPYLVERLLNECPNLNVELRESQEMRLMEFLRDDEIDVILGHLQIDTVNFQFEPLCEESLVIAIPENLMPAELIADAAHNGLARSSAEEPFVVDPELLSALPIVKPVKSQGVFLNFKQLMDVYHIHPPRAIQTANMVTAASMVQMGMGYMYNVPVLFEMTRVKRPKKVYCCTLPRLVRTRKFYIGYKAENPNAAVIARIKSIMLDIFKSKRFTGISVAQPATGSSR